MPRGRNIGLGIDWNFSGQEALITNRGEDLIHETGMKCICNLEDTYAGMMEKGGIVPRRSTTISCPICRGDGYIYRNPQRITALITSIRRGKERVESGWAMPGDCIMSVVPDYQISGGDLITFTKAVPLADGQVVVRGAGTDGESEAKQTRLEDNEDRLWYNAESSIWCEDEDGQVYENSAFQLDSSKIIKWVGPAPAKGKRYVIKYNAFLEWIVFLPPDVRVDRGRDLGARAALRKRHVAIVNEDPRPRSNDKMPFSDRIKV